MSIEAMTWVFKHSEVTGSERLVLLALADHAGDTWEAWPSVATIAAHARLKERATFAALKRLRDGGCITEVRRMPWGTVVYRIERSAPAPSCTPAQDAPLHETAVTPAPDRSTPLHGGAPKPPYEPPENQVVEDACACARLDLIDMAVASRRFAAAWPMEQAEVRMLIEAESPAVQEKAVDWLLSQYRTWKTHGVVWSLKGKVLPALRAAAEPPPQPAPYLFGNRPVSAAQQRAAWGAHYAAEAARLRAEEHVYEGEVIEG